MTDNDEIASKAVEVLNDVFLMKEGYTYPEAGPADAQPEVIEAVERWRNEVPDDVKEQKPLLYWLLGTGTPAYKMSQEDADYAHEPRGNEKCGNCEYAYEEVVTGKFICSKVRGEIQAEHWCRLWDGEQE